MVALQDNRVHTGGWFAGQRLLVTCWQSGLLAIWPQEPWTKSLVSSKLLSRNPIKIQKFNPSHRLEEDSVSRSPHVIRELKPTNKVQALTQNMVANTMAPTPTFAVRFLTQRRSVAHVGASAKVSSTCAPPGHAQLLHGIEQRENVMISNIPVESYKEARNAFACRRRQGSQVNLVWKHFGQLCRLAMMTDTQSYFYFDRLWQAPVCLFGHRHQVDLFHSKSNRTSSVNCALGSST